MPSNSDQTASEALNAVLANLKQYNLGDGFTAEDTLSYWSDDLKEAKAALLELIRQVDLKGRIDELDNQLPITLGYNFGLELTQPITARIEQLEVQLQKKETTK